MELQIELPLYWEAFIRLFYPSTCAECRSLLELEERGLCLGCRGEFQKLRFQPSEERIRISLASGDEGWALFRYQDAVKNLIHKIKFERRRDLLSVFRREIALFLSRRPQLARYDCVIPIPLDSARRSERQFNQSGLFARELRKMAGIRLDERSLLKRRSTSPQSLLGREARKINLGRAFHVSRPEKIRGRSILLVDDIFTTGATLEEAAKTLKGAGASRVGYLTLARALGN